MELQNFNKKDILTSVKVENEMFSLNDIHDLAGKPANKDPRQWLRLESTIQLSETVADVLKVGKSHIIKSKKGKGGGTFAHKNIALAYAKYLDPKLHVLVNEVFFERIEEEKNPELIVDRAISTYERKGMKPEWITKRLTAKGVRNEFTHLLKEHGVTGPDGYKDCTNAMYIGLYGKTASKIRKARNLPEKANLRENMSLLELQAISFAETLAMEDIRTNRKYGNEECKLSSNLASRTVSQSIINFRNKK